jgi:hypothetical protein
MKEGRKKERGINNKEVKPHSENVNQIIEEK